MGRLRTNSVKVPRGVSVLLLLAPEVCVFEPSFSRREHVSKAACSAASACAAFALRTSDPTVGLNKTAKRWLWKFHCGQPRQDRHCGRNLATPEKNRVWFVLVFDGELWLQPQIHLDLEHIKFEKREAVDSYYSAGFESGSDRNSLLLRRAEKIEDAYQPMDDFLHQKQRQWSFFEWRNLRSHWCHQKARVKNKSN